MRDPEHNRFTIDRDRGTTPLPPRNSAAGRRAVDLAPQTRLIAGRFLLFASLAK
jgi:hypothetical protein